MPVNNNYGAANYTNPYLERLKSAYYREPLYGQGPQEQANPVVYVHGIEGANAYQLPTGVNQQVLWDDTVDCFYIKGYDPMTGRPRVLAWNDFVPHKEPEKVETKNVDPGVYATKRDIEEIVKSIDLSQFMTKNDFANAIGKLVVGERGRVVIADEHDA